MNLAVRPLASEDTVSPVLRFPVSSSQERCWFINAMDPGTPSLNVALRWELHRRIDHDAIAGAFAVVIERHEALRTTVEEQGGELQQRVHPPFRPELQDVDLSNLPDAVRAGELRRLAEEEAHRPFDLARLPLIRIMLLRTAADEATLLVTIHQIAFDGWSIRLISREFGIAAAAIMADQPIDLPDLDLQYGDYAAWQKAWLSSGQFEREITYWKGKLADAPYFEVAADHRRPRRPTGRGSILATFLDADVASKMVETAKSNGVTLFALGCAVMAATLYRRTGTKDIVFGTQVAGRDDPDLEGLIGVFINNLVLRFDLSGDLSFDTLLGRVNGTVQEALVHQAMPFHRLVEILRPPRDPRRMPLISVNFTVLQDVMEDAKYGEFEIHGQPSLSAGSLYDLNFFMVHWSAGWRMALEYNTDLFDLSTGEAILALWQETLNRALAGCLELNAETLRLPSTISGIKDRGNVEAILLDHPAVEDAIDVLAEGKDGAEIHHAFVTVHPSYSGRVDQLSAILRAQVAMEQPGLSLADVSILMRMPRKSDGRIDIAALGGMTPELKDSAPLDETQLPPLSEDDLLKEPIRQIWTEVLGIHSVSDQTNFFAVGGHSLLAVRLTRRIADATGLNLAVGTVFAAPTFAAFMERLVPPPDGAFRGPAPLFSSTTKNSSAVATELKSDPGDGRTCIEVRPRGSHTSIFGINGIDDFSGFVKELGGDRGLYSVQLFEAGGPNPFLGKSFEKIAREYVDVIRRVEPEGPYILFGLCVHGVLALEIAHQLLAENQMVELLALKKTWHPTYIDRLSRLNRWMVRLAQIRDNFAFVLRGEKSFVSFLANYRVVQRSGILQAAVRLRIISVVPSKTGSEFNDDFLLSLMEARDRYRPACYDGAVIQYLGRDTPKGRGFDPTLGWAGTLIGPLSLRDDPEEQAALARGRLDAQQSPTLSLKA